MSNLLEGFARALSLEDAARLQAARLYETERHDRQRPTMTPHTYGADLPYPINRWAALPFEEQEIRVNAMRTVLTELIGEWSDVISQAYDLVPREKE